MGSMMFIGLYTGSAERGTDVVTQFLATVTHLMALSLITAGCVQLLFVRFVADRLFAARNADILPNLVGAMTVLTGIAAVGATVEVCVLFPGNVPLRVIFVSSFVALSNVWLLTALMSGLKRYRTVLLVFGLGFGAMIAIALLAARFGLVGYLAGFFLGTPECFLACLRRSAANIRVLDRSLLIS